jgi:NodT family efflux transporter outer membrane factor (OMF) lipoprotein
MKETPMLRPVSLSIFGLLASTALLGCAVGPNYHRPTAPISTAYKEASGWQAAQPSDTLDRGDWWTVFGDPELDRLEAKVVVSNQNIAAAEAAYRQARAIVAEDRASLFPVVDLTTSAQVAGGKGSGAAGGGGGGGSGGSGSATTYRLSLGATWAPDLWGRIRRTIEGASASAQASAADLANARLSAQAELASDYLQLRADDGQIQMLQQTADDYERALRVSQNRYAVGVAARAEVLTAQTQLLNAQAQVQSVTRQRQTLEHAIAVLAGEPPAELTLTAQPFVMKIPATPPSVPSALLQRRPDIAAAERRSQAANAQIGVQVAAFFPDVTLTGNYGFAALDIGKLGASAAWSATATATETLIDFGARRARVRQARAGYDQSVAAYRQTVLTALQQVEDGLAAARYLEAQENLLRQSSAAADQNEQIVLNQYKAGMASATDVVVAENTALQARINLIVTQRDRLTAAVSLIEALGGGWSTGELPKRP